ncbi:MAG: HEAT repeat protein [Bacteroidia bacterium]|jgi:HEAT repeat protein
MTKPYLTLLLALSILIAIWAWPSEESSPGSEMGSDSNGATQIPGLAEVIDDSVLDGDKRLKVLRSDCVKNYHYDRDTGDVVGILMDKLQNGGTDQLHRAKEELSSLSGIALPSVESLLKRNFDSEAGFSIIQNTIEILGSMESDGAHDPLMKCLDHARDSVRSTALRSLSEGAARPQDFDRLLSHVPIERESPRQLAAIALYTADPLRAAHEYLDWFENGVFTDLWPYVISKVIERREPEIVARCQQLYPTMLPNIALWLAASAAAGGDEAAWDTINVYLKSDLIDQRTPALTALIGVGLMDEVRPFINSDADGTIRSLACQAALNMVPKPAWVDEEIASLLDDPSLQVRNMALSYLVSIGNASAQDIVISLLQGPRGQIQDAVLVLVPSIGKQTEFAKRCLETLLAVDNKNSHLELRERTSTLQAIGQLPLAGAAAYLRKVSLERPDEKIQGLPAHRFAMIQAANSGLSGRSYLMEAIKTEEDPVKRLDLIWSIASDRDELSRSFLIEHVQSAIGPNELLFSADRLARIGPTSRVAPVLKRVTLRCSDQVVRPALQCLLWKWY